MESFGQGFGIFSMFMFSACCLLLRLHSLLGLLLSLEVISLIMCFNFTWSFVHTQGFNSFVLVFLCFEVSIMSIFLSLMVAFVKASGCDYVGVLGSSRAL
uniref:NADH dehydrogenase subunit 4L n=1 Tax=Utterbackia peninsularis TaxID=872316 RepID=F4ZG79_9BIVA|nr:NADH dehydrogenase subunit 4L [Utterbackia peninsularis]ADL62600.1 NADH dehydrogenase subunit 4L [Utterbackia peninsularis]